MNERNLQTGQAFYLFQPDVQAGNLNIAGLMRVLEPLNSKWHTFGYLDIIGNVILVMFYTTVAGWGFAYFYKELTGFFNGFSPEEIAATFEMFPGSTEELMFWMALVMILGFFICSLGLQSGIERMSKFMISGCLLLLILIFKAVSLAGASEGLSFYLRPDFSNFRKVFMLQWYRHSLL